MIRIAVSLFTISSLCTLTLPAKDSLTPYTKADQVPQSATALWDSYDSTVEPLDIKVHHEWKKDGVVSRLVTFKVGTHSFS